MLPGWAITAAGTLAFDDLTTPAGHERDLPGGSALYFSLAASRFCRVRAVAAIGEDGTRLRQTLLEAGVDCDSVAQLPGASYHWRAQHDPDATAPLREEQRLGVYLDWRPQLSPAARSSEILFLGSMHPGRQLQVLEQCPGARLVALDTMRDFIASDAPALGRLLERVGVFLANEAELRALLGDQVSPPAGLAHGAIARWGLQVVVLKRGRQGALLVSRDAATEYPSAGDGVVVDPTGAGDALAGGLLGRLAQLGRSDPEALEIAMVEGGAAARAAISTFGAAGLRSWR
ncbi:MAG: PfkB family carbohydrate kinase [Candidatus Dormibacteria bacterium]